VNSREAKAKAAASGLSEVDIRKQLGDIVASPVFAGGRGRRKKSTIGPLLTYLVEEMLAERNLSDRSVVEEWYQESYGEWPETNGKARANLRNLRFALLEYYATSGSSALILIEIPPNQFTPEAKPNPGSPASQEVRKGLYQTHRESPLSIVRALKHFDNAIRSEPEFAEAYAGKSGALIVKSFHTFTEPPNVLFAAAEAAALRAVTLDPKNSWRGHLNLANVSIFRHDWEAADRSIAKAQKIVGSQLFDIGACGPYLIARGRYKEAAELAALYRREYVDQVLYLNRAALYEYLLRHYEVAYDIISEISEMEEHFWQAHLIGTLICLAKERNEEALEHMLRVEPIIGTQVWPGILILCLAVNGKTIEAEEKFTHLLIMSRTQYVQSLQLAIAHMAMEKPLEAIEFLEKACVEHDPFTAFLHVLGIVDPLRGFPQFQYLLRRLKFPRFDVDLP
jgi:tetratricopeptide (TPR) repeat protein